MDPKMSWIRNTLVFLGRTVDGPNGGAADEVRVLLVHRLQLHPHLEPVHLGRGRLLLEAPARQGGCNNDILLPNRKMQLRSSPRRENCLRLGTSTGIKHSYLICTNTFIFYEKMPTSISVENFLNFNILQVTT
jgi:hypothetical protein